MGYVRLLKHCVESYGLNFETYASASEVIGKLLTLKRHITERRTLH